MIKHRYTSNALYCIFACIPESFLLSTQKINSSLQNLFHLNFPQTIEHNETTAYWETSILSYEAQVNATKALR